MFKPKSLEDIQQRIAQLGVCRDRLPTATCIVSHLLEYVDTTQLTNWLIHFAAIETDATPARFKELRDELMSHVT